MLTLHVFKRSDKRFPLSKLLKTAEIWETVEVLESSICTAKHSSSA